MIPRIASAVVLPSAIAAVATTAPPSSQPAPSSAPAAATGQVLGFPGFFRDGVIHVFGSSHQDIAWMDTPDACAEQRDRQVITPAIELMDRDAHYRFSMENTLYLMEYLQRRPDRRARIAELIKAGRLEWGATYTQPYESLESSEMLARQLYYGRKWLRREFPGADAVTAWNPDVPARALQMPQLLHKAGVRYLIHSRFAPGFRNWQSPDGSGVLAWSPGHYMAAQRLLAGDAPVAVAGRVARAMRRQENLYQPGTFPPVFPVYVAGDSSGPPDYGQLLRQWSDVRLDGAAPPPMRYSTGTQFMNAIAAGKPTPQVLLGERPNVWVYIHGPTHHWAIDAKRRAAVLLPPAETFSTIAAVLANNFKEYPAADLDAAWQAAIYPDHGWGGKHGDVTDDVFKAKLESARDAGQQLLHKALNAIANRVAVQEGKGTPLVVFNALSWQRSDPVTCTVSFEHGAAASGVQITDAAGTDVPCQILAAEHHRDGSIKSAAVMFVATDVPSLGYGSWYARPAKALLTKPAGDEKSADGTWENDFYRLELGPGGIKRLLDKQLGREVLRTDKFLGFEPFTMQSIGTGAHEFPSVQQPTMQGFDKLSNYRPTWTCVEAGSVRTVFQAEKAIEHCTLRLRVIAYAALKRLDCEVDILAWDGTPYREFRLAIPLNQVRGQVAYEVPFGAVEVGRGELAGMAGERYTQQLCKDVRPREVQNWIGSCETPREAHASQQTWSVTLTSGVAACDWVDPTDGAVGYPILQPLLLASRKSCHKEGNWYLQKGDHAYRFSLTSHPGDWRAGHRAACQANSPLLAAVPSAMTPATRTPGGPRRPPDRSLPEAQSFCRVAPDNLIISALKKSDDDDGVVIRCYDLSGQDSRAQLEFFLPPREVRHTNLLEEEVAPIRATGRQWSIPIGHHGIETMKLRLPPMQHE